MGKKKYFIVYYDYKKKLDRLSDSEFRKIIDAMFYYAEHGVAPKFESLTSEMVWLFIQDDMDRANENYAKMCELNSKRGQKGGAKPGNKNAAKNKDNAAAEPNDLSQTFETSEISSG